LNNDGSSGLNSAEQPGLEKLTFPTIAVMARKRKQKNKDMIISTCHNGDDNKKQNNNDMTTSGRSIG